MENKPSILRLHTVSWVLAVLFLFGCHGCLGQNGTDQLVVRNNCTLVPESSRLRNEIEKVWLSDVYLINFELVLRNTSGTFTNATNAGIFQLFHWQKTKGKLGEGLLLVNEAFSFSSLSTLSLGIHAMKVGLKENPWGCLAKLNVSDVEQMFRTLLLNNFNEQAAGEIEKDNKVCNAHIRNNNGQADFFHICCQREENGDVICNELIQDKWISVLLACKHAMYVIILLFSPALLPASLFQDLVSPRIIKVKRENSFIEENGSPKLFKCRYFITYNQAPDGFMRITYNGLFRCAIRHSELLRQCCSSDMFGRCSNYSVPWYTCCRKFMTCILYVLFISPWVVRVIIYYTYENVEQIARREAASKLNLDTDVSLSESLFIYVTPLYVTFILFYTVLALVFLFSFFVYKFVATSIIKTVAESFHFMLKLRKQDPTLEFLVKIVLIPFSTCGVFGLLIFPFYALLVLPVTLGVCTFVFVPLLNLLLRLLMSFCSDFSTNFCKEKAKKAAHMVEKSFSPESMTSTKSNEIIQVDDETLNNPINPNQRLLSFVRFVFSILTTVSLACLAMEIISFLVQIIVYNVVGIVLYSAHLLKYVTLVFMVVVYANSCFSGVTRKYIAFNNSINEALQKLVNKDLKTAVFQSEPAYENMKSEANDVYFAFSYVHSEADLGHSGLFPFFVDRKGSTFIARGFYNRIAKKDVPGCPGSLPLNMFRALCQFVFILLFLLFVLLIVLAFGENNSVTGVNQMFATLAGGLLPWVFLKILVLPVQDKRVDMENPIFKSIFDQTLREYLIDDGILF